MKHPKLAFIMLILFILFCTKFQRDNPLDANGENFYPPVLRIQTDTITGSKVAGLDLQIESYDSNGTVEQILWSTDGKKYNSSDHSGYPFP